MLGNEQCEPVSVTLRLDPQGHKKTNGNQVIPERTILQAIKSAYSRTCVCLQTGSNLIIIIKNILIVSQCCTTSCVFTIDAGNCWTQAAAGSDHPGMLENSCVSETIWAFGSYKSNKTTSENAAMSFCLPSLAILLGFSSFFYLRNIYGRSIRADYFVRLKAGQLPQKMLLFPNAVHNNARLRGSHKNNGIQQNKRKETAFSYSILCLWRFCKYNCDKQIATV